MAYSSVIRRPGRLAVLLVLSLARFAPAAVAGGGPFAFAVTSDPHDAVDAFQLVLQEIKAPTTGTDASAPACGFLAVAGDLHRLEALHAAYRETFDGSATMRAFLPATGDHSQTPHREYMNKEILAKLPQAVVPDARTVNYTFDWRNVRLVVADPNQPLHGANRFLNENGCKWVEEAIRAAPPAVEHIFIVMHEPPFPRQRHEKDMTPQVQPVRDAFWNMLLKHRSRVRAVFTGHTHYYNRMRVAAPAGAAANDLKQYPDEKDGLWQISVGASGARTDFLSYVRVVVDGSSVKVATYTREGTAGAFNLREKWALTEGARP